MKQKLRSFINEIVDKAKNFATRIDEQSKNYLKLATAGCVALIFVSVVTSISSESKYIVDDEGELIGIVHSDKSQSQEYYITLQIEGEEASEYVITKKAVSTSDSEDTTYISDDEEALRVEEISEIIAAIEASDEVNTIFPTSLSDGTALFWSITKYEDSNLLALLAVYLVLVVIIVKGSIDNKNNSQKEGMRQILYGLPRFTNQLLLMMNAGLILPDAFNRICDMYEAAGNYENEGFQSILIDKRKSNRDQRVSTGELLREIANEYGVKELMRISMILIENEKRGHDVIESLTRESQYLWDNRKLIASERGKMIDIKMTYPLGALLIMLIVITMAPALLTM